ncbi:MAG: hypothetical protein J6A21_02680 [Lentisphaeria bacterium]|nr:hypothetical protein [Lentisphaeria bacterium]
MLNLDGLWEFALTERGEESPVYDSFAAVPGSFDAVGLAFNRRVIGNYRKRVAFTGKMRLKIGSFGLHIRVFFDGKFSGESYFAWSPFETVLDGGEEEHEHVLELKVDNFIEGHPLFIDRYDFYGFGGIFDHVTLEEVREKEVESIRIHTLDHVTGEIALRVESKADFLRISFDGGKAKKYPNTGEILRLKVPSFRLWTPETPFLHRITVNEKTVEFGVRTLDWKGSHLLLNGKRIKLKGVNRHESHPEFGAATPESLILSDLLRIKKAGFNFIRGSHYPQREFFFRCCDRLGIMVWEEPLSWGNREEELSPRFLDALAQQLALTIRTSYNHPSLVIHGFLNECASDTDGGVAAVKRMMEVCHREDPSRPATFASNRVRNDRCLPLVDILAMNVYPAWYGTEKLSGIKSALDAYAEEFKSMGKPMVISEIGAAAMYGNHSEEPWTPWSEEFQAEYFCNTVSAVRENPLWDGFMLWLYCNANTYTETVYKTARPRGFNNKGLLDEYRRPKLAWREVKKLLAESGKDC